MPSKSFVLTLIAALILFAALGQAQTATTGQVAGEVTDPSGAVISGAKVVLTSDVGVRRETATTSAGRYVFPLVPSGIYKLEINAPGFAAPTLDNVVVRITEVTTLDIGLKVAAGKESVAVSATASLVQTENAGRGLVIEEGQIRQLPMPTRNFTQLLALTTGTTSSVQNSSELGRGDAVLFVNGQRSLSNAVVINGVDANSIGTGSLPNIAVPATDSIQEFIVQTSLFDASQGRNTGGAVAVVTKSGTNKFHGDAYEFFRNSSLNANDYFLKKEGVDRPAYNRNQFGGTLGGPIVKDRVWFFGSYQGTREKNGTSLLNSISTTFVPGDLGPQRDAASLAALSTKFGLGGFIDPRALAVLKATLPNGRPLIPSAPGATTGIGSNTPVAVTIPSISTFNENQFNTNLDIKISDKHRFAGKFFFANIDTHQALYSSFGGGNSLQEPGWPVDQQINHRLLSTGVTSILSANLLNDAKFGWSTIYGPSIPSEPITAASLGISNPLGSLFPGMPTLSVSNMFDIGPSQLADNFSEVGTYTFSDTMAWTHGKHTMKFGGEYKRQYVGGEFNAYTRGQVAFLGFLGDPFKDFLGGLSGLSIIGSGNNAIQNRAKDFAFFFQDDWKLLPRLTVNLGLRWDYYGPTHEVTGRFIDFDPSLATTVPIPGGVAVTGGFLQAGNGNLPNIPKISDSLVDPDYNNFGPRIGFAYQPLQSRNVVIRGGYGIYYDRPNMRLYNSQLFNTPYYMIATVFATPLNNPFVQVPLPNAFPLNFKNPTIYPFGGPPAVLPAAVTGGVTIVPSTGIYPDRHIWATPYVQQYNFGAQWGFGNSWMLDVGYVGSNGHKLSRLYSINQPPAPGAAGGPFYPGLSNLPLPVFGNYVVRDNANSNYNSLQVSLNRRMSKGLQFLISYTYSHSLDDYSGGDVSDLTIIPGDQVTPFNNNYATSDFDRRHRFVASYVYDVPKFYHGDSRAAGRILNHWEFAGITTLQTGTPFSILGNATAFQQTLGELAAGRTLDSAILTGPVTSRLGGYFDNTAFVLPSGTDFGHVGRNIFRGPKQTNVDFSIIKFVPVTESQKLEFRTEFFNLFNTPNFANPVNVISSANFGQVVKTSTGPRGIQFALKYSF